MKTRLSLPALLAGLLCGTLTLAAIQPPPQGLLPNLDARVNASGAPRLAGLTSGDAGAGFSATQLKAISALRERIPTLEVEASRFTRSPRLLTSYSGFLTGPGGAGAAVSASSLAAFPANDRHRLVKAFVNDNQALFGHNASALTTAVVKREYITKHNGLQTTIWQQQYAGIPVFDAVFQAHVTKKGELARISSQFLADPASAGAKGQPDWSSVAAQPPIAIEEAVARAAVNAGSEIAAASVRQITPAEGAELKSQLLAAGLNGKVYAELTWLPLDATSMRLCWQVVLVPEKSRQMLKILVDAQTGAILVRRNLTTHQAVTAATYSVFTSHSPSPFSPGWQEPNSYQPMDLSTPEPEFISRTVLSNFVAISLTASPAGWLNPPDPLNGAYNTTGNNVDAHTDLNDDDEPDLPRPQSTEDPPVFDFPLDLTLAPLSYTNASVVNLFYWNNFMHDKLYELGFTEAAGNFQNDNFGRGGQGNDAVEADAQDGALLNDYGHYNNANFYTPPDGIPGRMQMYLFNGPTPYRDGDLDADVMCHEYTHGLSGRLVGGGVGISALQTAGMGEGWSDFYPLCLLTLPTEDPRAAYQTGPYASYMLYDLTENYYFGIRRYPYSTDMDKNPLTYKDIDPTQADSHFGIPRSPIYAGSEGYPEEVHFQGEVWCSMLWEVRANLVDTYGPETGTTLALQLVTDAMKLCPPNPTFIESRDAIVEADNILTGGANAAEIWTGFAKRGMGYGARGPASDTTVGVIESYELPPGIGIQPPTGVLSISVSPANQSTLFAGATTPVYIRVRDGTGVTNAVVVAKMNGTIDVPINNAGVPPDARAGDSIYSGNLVIPDNATNVTLFIAASAPGKTNAVLNVSYFVARHPDNDMFANRQKVPGPGQVYLTNNRFATVQTNEPPHAGVTNFTGSLWWSWTPTNNNRALIDTGGSAVRTIVAVYTGDKLESLKQVAAVAAVPQRKQAFLQFDAKASTTYQICVAGFDQANAGFLQVRIAPNGQPDVTPPVVSVAKPQNGYIWTNNVIEVIARAYDPEPFPTGIGAFSFRVAPSQLGPDLAVAAQAVGDNTGSATNRIALSEGRNLITVTVSDGAGNLGTTNIIVTYRRPEPYNDHFVNAGLFNSEAGEASVANARATKEQGEPPIAGNDGGKSVWWKFRPQQDGVMLLSTEGSDFDTLLGLYTGEFVYALHTVAANDDAFDTVKYSKIRQAVRKDVEYHVAVDGFNAATGIVHIAYAFTPALLHYVDVSATVGGTVSPGVGRIDVEAGSSIQLTAVPASGYEFALWEGSVNTIVNPVTVTVGQPMAIRAVFRPIPFTDGFESGDLGGQPWTTGGAAPWYVTDQTAANGKYSVRSGAIGNSQSSSLSLRKATRAGLGTFSYKVSSEQGWDFLEFYIDGVRIQRWSGEIAWTEYQFATTAGEHVFEWRYVKDADHSVGLDAVFMDNLMLPVAVPGDGVPPVMSITEAPIGGVEVILRGQTNQIYVLQAADAVTGRWQNIHTNEARFGEIRYYDPESLTLTNRFYRGVKP